MYKAIHFNKCIFWEQICKPKHILSLRDIFKMHRSTEFKWTFYPDIDYFNISEKVDLITCLLIGAMRKKNSRDRNLQKWNYRLKHAQMAWLGKWEILPNIKEAR